MRLPTLLTLITTTALATWTVPPDLPDGLYTITFPSSSSSSTSSSKAHIKRHQTSHPALLTNPLLNNTPPTRSPSNNPTLPFPLTAHRCIYNQPPFHSHDLVLARKSLAAYCSSYLVPPRTRHIAVAKSGGAAAYVCNWDRSASNPCSMAEMDWVEEHVLDAKCGELQSGWAEADGLKRRYGRAYKEDVICAFWNMVGSRWVGVPEDVAVCDENDNGEKVCVESGYEGDWITSHN